MSRLTFDQCAAAVDAAGVHWAQSATQLFVEGPRIRYGCCGSRAPDITRDTLDENWVNENLAINRAHLDSGIVNEQWEQWASDELQATALAAVQAMDTDGDYAITWPQLWTYAEENDMLDEAAYMLRYREPEYKGQLNSSGALSDLIDGSKAPWTVIEIYRHYDRVENGQYGNPETLRSVFKGADTNHDSLVSLVDIMAYVPADFWTEHAETKQRIEDSEGWRLGGILPTDGNYFFQDLWQSLTVEDWIDLADAHQTLVQDGGCTDGNCGDQNCTDGDCCDGNCGDQDCTDGNCGDQDCTDGDCPIAAIESEVLDLVSGLAEILSAVNEIKQGGVQQYTA